MYEQSNNLQLMYSTTAPGGGEYINNEDYLRIKCFLKMICLEKNVHHQYFVLFNMEKKNEVYFIVHPNFVALYFM